MLTALRALGISQMIIGEPVMARDTFAQAQELALVVQQQSREHRIAVAQRFAADPEIATQFMSPSRYGRSAKSTKQAP